MRKFPNRPVQPISKAKVEQTTKVLAAYQICVFANGKVNCTCWREQTRPCESVDVTADAIIEAAKESLSKEYILRPRPKKKDA